MSTPCLISSPRPPDRVRVLAGLLFRVCLYFHSSHAPLVKSRGEQRRQSPVSSITRVLSLGLRRTMGISAWINKLVEGAGMQHQDKEQQM